MGDLIVVASLDRGRDYVYSNGTLWERALFGHLFDGRSVDHLYACLLAYKNPDGGYGHGLERDLTCPDSNPLQLEFLLRVLADYGLPPGSLLDGAAAWVEQLREDDGSLRNPSTLFDYPHAPWWKDMGGQRGPASITGNLLRLGRCTPSLAASTEQWVRQNLMPEQILDEQWLFMLYHAYDFYWHAPESDVVRAGCRAVEQRVNELTTAAPRQQWYSLLTFAPGPGRGLTEHLHPDLLARTLEYLETTQRDDGGWDDQHGLAGWQPYVTTQVLWVLHNHGRLG